MKREIIPYNPQLKQLARNLRNDSTLGEILLWDELKTKKLFGYDFHRQKPLLNFIVDFYCSELNLAIEIDGYSHYNEYSFNRDKERETELAKWGVQFLRFHETDVRNDIVNVLREIEN